MAAELQEMWAVAQLPEAKVSRVAKPPPQAAELPQPQVGGLVQPPRDPLVQHTPPTLPASHALVAQQPPLPPPRWLHFFLGRPPPLPLLPLEASKPDFCPSQLGVATLTVW